ncbi:hypothetical protein [Kyrpidia spormannii]|uniref:Uncharacterized protein n=1 Tax=Kyrpidia spormannii TaxID=2055160 RepID=A0ACA8Z597_9BACL|nr:hypothetical protein [Kyrpidia spormannii]CAB3389765.1 conserved protein of unknown function [Kyrpidia spormannii]
MLRCRDPAAEGRQWGVPGREPAAGSRRWAGAFPARCGDRRRETTRAIGGGVTTIGRRLSRAPTSVGASGNREPPGLGRDGGIGMIEADNYRVLQREIRRRIGVERYLLDQLREEIRPLKHQVRQIQPRTTTSISLVGTDGGDNRLHFDPFLVQLIRVVDSSNNGYCLEAVTPTTSVAELSAKQFRGREPATPLGEMMAALGVRHLSELSPMIRESAPGRPVSPSWIQVYRELTEWAVLFSILRTKDFAADTLVVYDGLLRSKVFAKGFFRRLLGEIEDAVEIRARKSRRKIYLAGVAKKSKVLDRYRLAMALEQVLTTDYPAYVEVPREMEEKAYVWPEYAQGDDRTGGGGETENIMVGGKMFFVKFGSGRRDPVWPVDIFLPQVPEAPVVLGFLLADAVEGFPIPLYPRCLQKAHEHAALVDFDIAVLQDQIFKGIRETLGPEAEVLDAFRLRDGDPARLRYGRD